MRRNQGLIVHQRLKENGEMEANEHKYPECVTAAKRRAAKTQNELVQSNQLEKIGWVITNHEKNKTEDNEGLLINERAAEINEADLMVEYCTALQKCLL